MARLQGKSCGACHKCGASLSAGHSFLRARYCARCGTLYHTYDCGNRMATVLPAESPEDCPKVSQSFLCFSQLFASFKISSCLHSRYHPKRRRVYSVATFVIARPGRSSATPTGFERERLRFALSNRLHSKQFCRFQMTTMTAKIDLVRKMERQKAKSNMRTPKEEMCYVYLPANSLILSKSGLVSRLPRRLSSELKPSPRWTTRRQKCTHHRLCHTAPSSRNK